MVAASCNEEMDEDNEAVDDDVDCDVDVEVDVGSVACFGVPVVLENVRCGACKHGHARA